MIVKVFELKKDKENISLPTNIIDHCNVYKDKYAKELSIFAWQQLSKYIPLDKVKFNDNGKPYLLDNTKYFSLSHSGNLIAFAIDNKPIGIDIEQRQPLVVVRQLASRLLNKKQLSQYYKAKDNCLWFTKYWTQHEAYIKLLGKSFSLENFKEDIKLDVKSKIIKDSFKNIYYLSIIAIK